MKCAVYMCIERNNLNNYIKAYSILNEMDFRQINPSYNWYMTKGLFEAYETGLIDEERINYLLSIIFKDEEALSFSSVISKKPITYPPINFSYLLLYTVQVLECLPYKVSFLWFVVQKSL